MRDRTKHKSLRRWLEMSALGVETQAEALRFFRQMAKKHELRKMIPREHADHQQLLWLISGCPEYKEVCPQGVAYFSVFLNNEVGHNGTARCFVVMPVGANSWVPFSVRRALSGEPRKEKVA